MVFTFWGTKNAAKMSLFGVLVGFIAYRCGENAALGREGRPGQHMDQYQDGQAAMVWNLYIGGGKRTTEYRNILVEILQKSHVRTVLDSACGTGVDSFLLIEEGFVVKCMDLSDQMLKFAHKTRWNRRKEENFDNLEIGEGNWLDISAVEDSINHPNDGYDAIICLGNSFSHLPSNHTQAIENFHKFLKPGGLLLIDHRNFDYILEHSALPNSKSKLYYQGNRIQDIKTSFIREGGVVRELVLDYTIDISGLGMGMGSGKFSLSYYPHTLEGFTGLLKGVFGDDSEHLLLPDFSEQNVDIPSYYVHVIRK